MQPLLTYHSRLPLGLDLWQDLCYGRTMGPYFLLLTQAGCLSVYITIPQNQRLEWRGTAITLPARPALPSWAQPTPISPNASYFE